MISDLVFNHHCLPFDGIEDADGCIPEFLKICIRLQNVGIRTLLVDESVDASWFRLCLAKGYYWQDWYGKNLEKNRDLIRAFRSLATSQPLFRQEDFDLGLDFFEVRFQGEASYSALRAAAWREVPVTGFPTRHPWNTSPLTLEVTSMGADGGLFLVQKDVVNFCSLEILEKEIQALLEKRNQGMDSGRRLYEKRKEFFPHLVFCGNAINQLRSWSQSPALLQQVKETLTALNTFCEQWQENMHRECSAESLRKAGLNHRMSGESESVMNRQDLRKEREFWLPEGRKEFFQNHIKLSQGFRIHFFQENATKTIYVGHIGPHLKLG